MIFMMKNFINFLFFIYNLYNSLIIIFIFKIQSFIPESCCTSYDYLDEYIEPWHCNMLGIKKEVKIPPEIDESNYVLIGNEYF